MNLKRGFTRLVIAVSVTVAAIGVAGDILTMPPLPVEAGLTLPAWWRRNAFFSTFAVPLALAIWAVFFAAVWIARGFAGSGPRGRG